MCTFLLQNGALWDLDCVAGFMQKASGVHAGSTFWGSNRMMTSSNGNIFRVTGPLCGEFTGPGEFPTQKPVTRSFHVFFDLRLNKRLSKQPWGWWFGTPSWSLWRQCNGNLPTKITLYNGFALCVVRTSAAMVLTIPRCHKAWIDYFCGIFRSQHQNS